MEGLTPALRAWNPSDVREYHFVVASWRRSYADSPFARMMGDAYREGHEALIKHLLARFPVLVACDPEDHETIWGWACTGPGAVHYVYVKRKLRRQGVARRLVAPFVGRDTSYSHMLTFGARDVVIPHGWRFNFYEVF